jgi:L-threonylcarbamoyladenylate synthase
MSRILSAADCEAAANIIRAGGVIAYRTDTFYGLGADPLNRTAVQRVKELKGREDNKPILLLISDRSDVDRFISHQSSIFKSITQRFWPGPVTVVGAAISGLPQELTSASNTIGLRLPDDDELRRFIRACGGALTATSANVSGSEPARSALEARNYFPEGLDLIIDGGEVDVTQPSTVLDCSGPAARLIREGAVSRAELEDYL